MFINLPSRRHLRRYQEITSVFLKHGFGYVLDQLNIKGYPLWHLFLIKPKTSNNHMEDLAVHFRLALEELGPTFIKFGQILSTRPDLLPSVFIAELSKLQDTVPPEPWEKIQEFLVKEFGYDLDEVFTDFDPIPLASASLGQVHAAKLKDNREVVVKVQRPDILPLINVDLEILASLATKAQKTELGKIYDFITIADDFAFILRNELNYLREGKNADRFRQSFAGETHLYIPKVFWEYTTKHVLVLERIRGIKINDISALYSAGYDCHKIALHSARIIIKEVLEDGFFHADPHPGNFFVMPDEVIGAMDFGMVGNLKEKDRLNLIRLYLVAVELDSEAIVDQLIKMGAANVQIDRVALERDIDRLLKKYYGLPLKDIRAREVIEEITPIAFRHHLHLPSDFWLLGKTLTMMEGVGLQLDPNFDIFEVSKPYVQRLMWHLLLPNHNTIRSLLLYGADLQEMIGRFPQVGNRLFEFISEDQYKPENHYKNDKFYKEILAIEKLSQSILISCLIVSLSILISNNTTGKYPWLTVLLILLLLFTFIWFLISLIKSNKIT